jgi:chromate transporter
MDIIFFDIFILLKYEENIFTTQETSMEKNEFYFLSKKDKMKRLGEITLVFLKLGVTAFGGPAAHVAMMEEEIIRKRKWISKKKYTQ